MAVALTVKPTLLEVFLKPISDLRSPLMIEWE